MGVNKSEFKFAIGDRIYEVFFDDDIGAWNTCDFVCEAVKITITQSGTKIEYCPRENDDFGVEQTGDLFKTSLSAVCEAKRRNREMFAQVPTKKRKR